MNDSIDKDDRYIAIVGESWAEMLGQQAKYLTPKVGIVLHGENQDLRAAMSRMQVISGNAEMALGPLKEIMGAMLLRMTGHAKHNKTYKEAVIGMELALEHIKRVEALLDKTL